MKNDLIYAAIAGDIIGSRYERTYPEGPLPTIPEMLENGFFTDDTVLTIAVLEALKTNTPIYDSFKKWSRRYPNARFSKNFIENFIEKDSEEKSHSSSNGALMVLSPLLNSKYKNRLREVVSVSHDCQEAHFIAKEYLDFYSTGTTILPCIPYKDFLNEKKFCSDSLGTFMRAISIARNSTSFEDGINKSILLGGDTDTQASVTAPLLLRNFKLPHYIKKSVQLKLTNELLNVLEN